MSDHQRIDNPSSIPNPLQAKEDPNELDYLKYLLDMPISRHHCAQSSKHDLALLKAARNYEASHAAATVKREHYRFTQERKQSNHATILCKVSFPDPVSSLRSITKDARQCPFTPKFLADD